MSTLMLDIRDEGVVEIDDAQLRFTVEEHQACFIGENGPTAALTGYSFCEC